MCRKGLADDGYEDNKSYLNTAIDSRIELLDVKLNEWQLEVANSHNAQFAGCETA